MWEVENSNDLENGQVPGAEHTINIFWVAVKF